MAKRQLKELDKASGGRSTKLLPIQLLLDYTRLSDSSPVLLLRPTGISKQLAWFPPQPTDKMCLVKVEAKEIANLFY